MAEKQVKWWQWAIPIALLLGIWMSPTPEGLTAQAWHMFAIFVATIIGILCAPIASGALMFIALAVTIFTNTLSFSAALSGLASGTVWMIFSAYVLSLGFVGSGLGRRIAYKMLSMFGGSSLGYCLQSRCCRLDFGSGHAQCDSPLRRYRASGRQVHQYGS